MKKRLCILLSALLLVALASCGPAKEESGKIKIIATLFPQYDFAKQIAGDKAEVELLLPPGTESHMYDPTPKDISQISSADLFVYTGENMEPWAAKILKGISNDSLKVVDASNGVTLKSAGDGDHDHAFDPHIWLDIQNAEKMAQNVAAALCEMDSENAAFYKENAAKYREALSDLDRDFESAVALGKRKTMVFGGKFAYLYFIDRYGLSYKSAYASDSGESEPGVKTIAEIVSFVKENKIPYIYHEELSDPKVARSIADQTGAGLLEFSTVHNLTKDELAAGTSYIDLMRKNLANLKKGLSE